jgi:hypothetical protein
MPSTATRAASVITYCGCAVTTGRCWCAPGPGVVHDADALRAENGRLRVANERLRMLLEAKDAKIADLKERIARPERLISRAKCLYAEAKGQTAEIGLDVDVLYEHLLRRMKDPASGARYAVVVTRSRSATAAVSRSGRLAARMRPPRHKAAWRSRARRQSSSRVASHS